MTSWNTPQWLEGARIRAERARLQGTDRVWTARLRALDRTRAALGRADDLPVVGRLVAPVERLVDGRIERLAAVPVDGWDGLNARNAIAAVKGLDRVGLLAVRRREAATKDRKTVLAAIDKALELPELEAEPGVSPA